MKTKYLSFAIMLLWSFSLWSLSEAELTEKIDRLKELPSSSYEQLCLPLEREIREGLKGTPMKELSRQFIKASFEAKKNYLTWVHDQQILELEKSRDLALKEITP